MTVLLLLVEVLFVCLHPVAVGEAHCLHLVAVLEAYCLYPVVAWEAHCFPHIVLLYLHFLVVSGAVTHHCWLALELIKLRVRHERYIHCGSTPSLPNVIT